MTIYAHTFFVLMMQSQPYRREYTIGLNLTFFFDFVQCYFIEHSIALPWYSHQFIHRHFHSSIFLFKLSSHNLCSICWSIHLKAVLAEKNKRMEGKEMVKGKTETWKETGKRRNKTKHRKKKKTQKKRKKSEKKEKRRKKTKKKNETK